MLSRPNFSTEGSSQGERTPYADMEEMQTLEPKYDELAKVQGWRLHVLVEAGYPIELAETMASGERVLPGDCGAHPALTSARQADATLRHEA